jgi:hypothetical protein
MLPIVTNLLPTMLPFNMLITNDVTDVTDFSHFYVFLYPTGEIAH